MRGWLGGLRHGQGTDSTVPYITTYSSISTTNVLVLIFPCDAWAAVVPISLLCKYLGRGEIDNLELRSGQAIWQSPHPPLLLLMVELYCPAQSKRINLIGPRFISGVLSFALCQVTVPLEREAVSHWSGLPRNYPCFFFARHKFTPLGALFSLDILRIPHMPLSLIVGVGRAKRTLIGPWGLLNMQHPLLKLS